MLCRSVACLICMFVATVYSDTESTKEWSVTETTQESKQVAADDLGALLDGGGSAVVTLVAGDTQLVAHRAVLAAKSPVLADMLRHSAAEVSSGRLIIPDMEGPVLRQLLAYLYSLQVPRLPDMAPQLLAAAERFHLPALKEYCVWQLAAQLSVETAADVAALALKHSNNDLRNAAVKFIKYHVFEVFATKGWANVVANHPKEAIEVSRLLAGRLTKTSATATTEAGTTATNQPHSDPSQTPSTAAAPHTASPTSPAEDAIISSLRSLPEEEKERRLIEAARAGAVGDLQRLLAAGADVAARDERGTALHWAAGLRHLEAVRSLLEAGVEVDVRDDVQRTPLHWAATGGKAEVVRLLLSHSADPNARCIIGWSPLHYAALHGHTEVVAALLEGGANRGARDDVGYTALDIAKANNHQQIIELLTSS